MKEYNLNPIEGVCEAFFELNPDAELKDLAAWLRGQERSEADPRLPLYGLASLCEQALEKLTSPQDHWVDAPTVARIAFALAHVETAIRVYNALMGHRRFNRLAQLPPVEAARACLPYRVDLDALM